MKLTDNICRKAKYEGQVIKLTDGNGLYLKLSSHTAKYWRYDYRYGGKRKTLALGTFPALSLKDARIKLFAAKEVLAEGADPSYMKKTKQHISGDTLFENVATTWLQAHDCTDKTRYEIEKKFRKDVYPVIGSRPMPLITPMDVMGVMRRIESRGKIDLAHRVCTNISQVMRYGVYTGLIPSDPCRDLKGAIRKKRATVQYAAIVNPIAFGQLLRAMDTYSHNVIIGHCLRISPYLALRPTELREGEWSEIDWDNGLWCVPARRMKKEREHVVPLSAPALLHLRTLHKITGKSTLMFPSPVKPDQAISGNTVSKALGMVGYDGKVHTPHGFRSSFSTMANQSGLFRSEVVEAQLAHLDPNRVRAAYNRGAYIEERIELMNWWAERIEAMRDQPHTIE